MQRFSIIIIVSIIIYGIIALFYYGVNQPRVDSLPPKEEMPDVYHKVRYKDTICFSCHRRFVMGIYGEGK
jgi:hypothetical protein